MKLSPRDQNHYSFSGFKKILKRERLENQSGSTGVENFQNYKIAEQFFLFGGDPNGEHKHSPKVLVAFPSTPPNYNPGLIHQIMDLSYPEKFKKIKVKYAKDRVLMSEFVFTLNNAENTKRYGVCVQFRSIAPKTPFFSTVSNCKFPFCLCLITSTPFFTSHFQFLTYLALALSGKITPLEREGVVPGTLPPNPIPTFSIPELDFDFENPDLAIWVPFHAPLHLGIDLKYYFSLPTSFKSLASMTLLENNNSNNSSQLSSDGNSLGSTQNSSGQLPPIRLSKSIELKIPLHLTIPQCEAYASLFILFSSLSTSMIIELYTAMLLQYKIVFVSKFSHKSSLAVIGMQSILNPFHSVTQFLSILPRHGKWFEVLQIPVPYVVGALKGVKLAEAEDNLDFLVNLDAGTIHYASPALMKLPEIPGKKSIALKLEQIMESYKSEITRPVQGADVEPFYKSLQSILFPKIFLALSEPMIVLTPRSINHILNVFKNEFPKNLDSLMTQCVLADPEKPANVRYNDYVILSAPPNEKKFYLQFFQTEIFKEYSAKFDSAYLQKGPNEFGEMRPKSTVLNNLSPKNPANVMFESLL